MLTNIELKVKKSDIGKNIEDIAKIAQDTLEEMKTAGIFGEYTKHGIEHSKEMLRICEWISDYVEQLNDIELYLLVLSCYFHDVGMVVSIDEMNEMIDSTKDNRFQEIPTFKTFLEKFSENQNREKCFENYIRKYHHVRSSSYIKSMGEKIGIHKFLINILADICKSHGESRIDSLEVSLPFEYNNKKYSINVQYIAVLLRLSDILDLTDKRTPYHLYTHLKIKDKISLSEWGKHLGVNSVCIRQNNSKIIDISGETDNPDIYFAIEEFKNWIFEEIRYCRKIMENYEDSLSEKYKLKIENISLDKYRTIGFEKETLEITVDTKNIINLLIGKNLYNNYPKSAIRELLLNAIDACRAYKKIKSSYRPEIKLSLEKDNRKLIVDDNGIGMNEYIIKNFLLKAGTSYYSSNETEEDLKDYFPYSKFGIGFLSSFLIANKIDIETKHYRGNEIIKLVISDINKNVLIERYYDEYSPQGTIITLYLKENIDGLSDIVRYWVKHLEFDINVSEDFNEEKILDSGFDAKVQIGDSIFDENYDVLEEKEITFEEKEIKGYLKLIFENGNVLNMRHIDSNYNIMNKKHLVSQNGIFFTDVQVLPRYWNTGFFLYDIDILDTFRLNPELNRWDIVKDKEWMDICYYVEEKVLNCFFSILESKGLLDNQEKDKLVFLKFFRLNTICKNEISSNFYNGILKKLKWIENRGACRTFITFDELINCKNIEILPVQNFYPVGVYDEKLYNKGMELYNKFVDENAKETFNIPNCKDNYYFIEQYITPERINILLNGLTSIKMKKLDIKGEKVNSYLFKNIICLPFYRGGEREDNIFMTKFIDNIVLNSNHTLVKELLNIEDKNIKYKLEKLIERNKLHSSYFLVSKNSISNLIDSLKKLFLKENIELNINLDEECFLKPDIKEYWFSQVESMEME